MEPTGIEPATSGLQSLTRQPLEFLFTRKFASEKKNTLF